MRSLRCRWGDGGDTESDAASKNSSDASLVGAIAADVLEPV